MLSPQGSEVIIPNGDLLSGRLVNWTLSHDYVKTELTFKVGTDTNLDILYKLIGDELKKSKQIMSNLPTEILLNSIAAGAIELKVMAWVNNIYIEASFKSDFMFRLIKKLNELEIKVL